MRLALAFVVLAGCGGTQAAPTAGSEPTDEETAEPEPGESMSDVSMAPTPFTVEQLRAGCPQGRTDVFEMADGSGEPMRRRTTFVAANEDGASFEQVTLDDAGQPAGESTGGSATWEELRQHASYPSEQTVITQTSVEVPAGTFAAHLYVVTDDATVTRAWFADELPGPPVRHIVEVDGAVVSSMTLVSVETP